MIRLSKKPYWDNIINYYYDYVRWEQEYPPTLCNWLSQEYNANTSVESMDIEFKNQTDMTWFLLRWAQ